MKSSLRCLVALALLIFAQTLSPAITPLPPNPHQLMNASASCPQCHRYFSGSLAPHEFIVEIPPRCGQCHTPDKLGRSHPVGIDPTRSPEISEVPEELPLENGLISCGSCHNPHGDFLSKTKSFKDQPTTFVQVDGRSEIHWYKTLYLRISDPIKGFEPLCLACHRDY